MPGKTMYVTPAGDGVAFASGEPNGFADITDGSSNTVGIFECGSENAVPWSAPQDFDVGMLASVEFDTGHPGTFNAAMCDGSTHALSKFMSAEVFQGMCIIADGKLTEW